MPSENPSFHASNQCMVTRSQKSEREAAYRAKRKAKKLQYVADRSQWLACHNAQAEENRKFADKHRGRSVGIPHIKRVSFDENELGFHAIRVKRNGELSFLPKEYNYVFSAVRQLLDNPRRLEKLFAWNPSIRNIQARDRTVKALIVILSNTDLSSGRIGISTTAGFETLSWDHMQEDYALRFGEFICPQTFSKVISRLSHAGYLNVTPVTAEVDNKSGEVRSAPAYKQWTAEFFRDLKVTLYSKIAKLISDTRARLENDGQKFDWVTHRLLTSRVVSKYRKYGAAIVLNSQADFLQQQISLISTSSSPP